ncbi:MAG: right-handed parallel beta-helix repeat-containing protein, partial [Verrucomicrobiaceae bacterium]
MTLTVRPPQIFYVDGGIGVSGDGKSWGSAFKTVQEAVAASVAISANASAEIWVKTGTYPVGSSAAALKMSWQVQLYGGFAGTEISREQRDWVNNVTTFISAGHGVMIEDSGAYSRGYGGSLLDGFTISGASQNGYSVYQAAPLIRNCIFSGAASGVEIGQYASPTFQGCTFRNLTNIPVRANGESLVLDNCTFQNNANNTGTVVVSAGKTVITGSQFTGNSGGPVLSFTGSTAANVTISRSKFTGNATLYDLISVYPKISLSIDNSLIADNQTVQGSVVQCEGPQVQINYCTIANNRHQASAIGVGRASQTSVKYSILWGNRNTRPLVERLQQGVTDLKTSQVCVLPYASGATVNVFRGILEGVEDSYTNENYGYNPLFADAEAGDYSLGSNSPAIGRGVSGDAAAFGTLDLAGAPRRFPSTGGLPDAGAYEYQSAPSATLQIYGDYSPRRVIVGTTTVFTFMGPNEPVQWQVDKGDGNGFVALSNGSGVAIQTGNPKKLTLSNVGLSMSGYKYRFVMSGGHPYTSPPSTLTVVAKPIRYVNPLATGLGNGTSWANAYPALLTALSDISSSNLNGNPET